MQSIYSFVKKRLSDSPMQSVGAAALVIAIAGIFSRVLGLVRDRILAHSFGAGEMLDIYYASFRIPDLLFTLIVVGALSSAFVPVFTNLLTHKKKRAADKLASSVLTLLILLLVGLSLLFALFAPYLVPLLVPGFGADALAQTVLFTRILFLSTIFLGISAVWSGILMSHKRFFIYSLAPIFYNVGIIVGAVWFVPWIGPIGLAWGVVLGSCMHMLIQVPSVKQTRFSFIFTLKEALFDKNVQKVGALMVPRIFSSASSQISFLIITFFASTLAAGSIAVFTFANNIQSVVLGLIGVPFAIAAFPTLSTLYAKKNTEEFVSVLSKTLRRVLYLVIPLSVIILLLRAQIVRVLLGTGEFNWEDTILTFTVMGILAASLFGQCSVLLLSRAFFAMHDTKWPFFIALVSQVVNVILVLVLIEPYGVYGIATAFSCAVVVNMILLLLVLKKRLHVLDEKAIASSLIKITFATLVMAIVIQLGKEAVGAQAKIDTFIEVLAQLVGAGVIGIGTYLYMSTLLRIEEFAVLKKDILTRILRRPAVAREVATEESHQENV